MRWSRQKKVTAIGGTAALAAGIAGVLLGGVLSAPQDATAAPTWSSVGRIESCVLDSFSGCTIDHGFGEAPASITAQASGASGPATVVINPVNTNAIRWRASFWTHDGQRFAAGTAMTFYAHYDFAPTPVPPTTLTPTRPTLTPTDPPPTTPPEPTPTPSPTPTPTPDETPTATPTAEPTLTPTTTPVAVKPLFGGASSANSTWPAFEKAFGPAQVRRTYGSTIPANFEASQAGTANDYEAHRWSYWSFKPNVTTFVGDTAQHERLRAFLRTVPVGHPFTLITYHEPEDNIAAGAFTLADWKATVTLVGKIVDEINAEQGPASELRSGICLMGPWTFDTRSDYDLWDWSFTPEQLARIDVVGIDPYKWNPGDPAMWDMLTRNDTGTKPGSDRATMTKLAAWGKPISLMEWGVTATGLSDAQRGEFITGTWQGAKAWNAAHPELPVESLIYFHTNQFVADQPKATWEVLGAGQKSARDALTKVAADARN